MQIQKNQKNSIEEKVLPRPKEGHTETISNPEIHFNIPTNASVFLDVLYLWICIFQMHFHKAKKKLNVVVEVVNIIYSVLKSGDRGGHKFRGSADVL